MPIDRTSANAVNPFQDKSASFMRRIFRYTGPASYATGGESLPVGNSFGIGRVYTVLGVLWNGTGSYTVWWDRTNSKLVLIDDGTGAEVANGTDTSAYVGQLEAIGY